MHVLTILILDNVFTVTKIAEVKTRFIQQQTKWLEQIDFFRKGEKFQNVLELGCYGIQMTWKIVFFIFWTN